MNMKIESVLPTPWDPNEFIANEQRKKGQGKLTAAHGFTKASEKLKEYLDKVFDRDKATYMQRQHDAIIGEPAAQSYFYDEIQSFLRRNPQFQDVKFPECYKSLKEALFHHNYGFGPMAAWFDHPTESAHVNGTSILWQVPGKNTKELQSYKFDSMDQVYRVIRAITRRDPSAQISATKNTTEVEMLDGTRVTILTPPLSQEPFIAFRQYPFREFSFEEEARKKTIPDVSIPWFKLLSKTMLNMFVTGFRGSGKTTILKVFYAEREPQLTVATIENKTFEARLKQNFPDRAPFIVALKPTLDEMHEVFPMLLRADAHYIMVPEVRSGEVDTLFHAGDRGNGYLASFHGQDLVSLPSQLASLSLDAFPQRSFLGEKEKAAKILDIVVKMTEDHTGRKIVTGVYAFDYEDVSSKITMTPWMVFDHERDMWSFQSDIPERIKEKIRAKAPGLFDEFRRELQKLAELFPYDGDSTFGAFVRGAVS